MFWQQNCNLLVAELQFCVSDGCNFLVFRSATFLAIRVATFGSRVAFLVNSCNLLVNNVASFRLSRVATFLVIIGVKRNAERYMFSEPRPPVDALRARIRESRFSFRHVLPDGNLFVTFAKGALLGPKVNFWVTFRILSPKIDFGAQNELSRPKSLLGQKELKFHQNLLVS